MSDATRTGPTIEVSRSDSGDGDDEAPLPDRIGRFEVIELIGVGGMGRVYSARDLQLDRIVALKVLLRGGDDERRTRLIREARAMAQVRHENVVTVFAVGEHATEQSDATPLVFVAMERVEGRDLRAWLEETPRTREQILDAFIRAGRGLAAAHEGGVVHRDFKPANVMVDTAGQIKVLDFGLAVETRMGGDEVQHSHSGEPTTSRPEATREGVVVGTPKYMAPEQHLGEEATPAADQYAFCVALFEALVGRPPFSATSYRRLVLAKVRTKIRDIQGFTDLPDWLQRVLRRGLDPRPNARWPSMNALLHALDRTRDGRKWRHRLALAIGATAVVGAGAWLLVPETPSPCDTGEVRLRTVWSASRIAALGERATEHGELAARAWARAEPVFDGFADTWSETFAGLCAETTRADARIDCLGRRLDELDASVRVLEQADVDVWIQAHQVALALGPPAACAEARADVSLTPSDPHVASDVEDVRRSLEWASARMHGGDVMGARAIALTAAARADALGFAPLTAEAHLRLGQIRLQADDDLASDDLRTAYFAAKDAGHVAIEISAASMLVQTTSEVGDFEGARTWVRHAQSALDRAGWPAADHTRLLGAEASMLQDEGHAPEAIEKLREALAVARRGGLRDVMLTSLIGNNLAYALFEQGRYEEALELHLEVLATRRAELGDHPHVVTSLNNVGYVLDAQGRREEALEYHEEALERARRIYGEQHSVISDTLNSIALQHHERGESKRARELLEQAVAIAIESEGEDGALVAQALSNLGVVTDDLGDSEAALRYYERALGIFERTRGASHPRAASVMHNIGNIHVARGDTERGVELFRKAIAIREQANGPKDAKLAFPLTSLGAALTRLGRTDEAIAVLERALDLRLESAVAGPELALTRLRLAQAIAPADPVRARMLASEARATYAEAAHAESVAEVDAFLATLP